MADPSATFVHTQTITFPFGAGAREGYLARPDGDGPFPVFRPYRAPLD